MKKLIFNIFAVMALIVGFSSCAPTEIDDIFDDSAAVRLDKAKATYSEFFTDKGGKWVMNYFCNAEEPGYAFVITFDKNGSVTIAGENDYLGGYLSDVSLWDVIADNGPVLTFNTYNNVLHTFSNPEDIPGTTPSETGYGHEGDYEFMIISTTDDQAVLRGKKTGYTIIMDRLDSTVDDKEYMEDVTAKVNTSFSSSIDSLYLETANGVKFVVFNASSMVWDLYPYGQDAITTTETQNCLATANGIRFLYPLSIVQEYDGKQEVPVQNFVYQPDGTLLCTDDNATRIYGDPLSTIFLNRKITWSPSSDTMEGQFAATYAAIEEQVPSVFGKTSSFAGFTFNYNVTKEVVTMRFLSGRNGRTAGNIYFNVVKVDDNTIRLSLDTSTDAYGDNNGRQHYTRLDAFKQLVELLTGSDIVLSADNLMCPNPLTFASKANSADKMVLTF